MAHCRTACDHWMSFRIVYTHSRSHKLMYNLISLNLMRFMASEINLLCNEIIRINNENGVQWTMFILSKKHSNVGLCGTANMYRHIMVGFLWIRGLNSIFDVCMYQKIKLKCLNNQSFIFQNSETCNRIHCLP